eukprot:gene16472-22694_t
MFVVGITPSNDLVPKILTMAKKDMMKFQAQGIANTLWALAKMDYQDSTGFVTSMLKGARNKTSSKLGDFEPQHVGQTLWALATLKHDDPEFVGELLEAATPKLKHFSPQNLANTAWALATLDYRGDDR